MVLQPTSRPDLPSDADDTVVLFRTRSAPRVPAAAPTPLVSEDIGSTSRPATGAQGGLSRRAIRQLEVLDVTGRLSDVVKELDRAIQMALAAGSRGVVCDLSAVLEGADPAAVEVLASAGRHVRDWPGVPVAVACPDPRVREALRAQPLGEHLIVTASLFSALSAVLAAPGLAVEWRRLAPHPTAARASREFVALTLRGWGLDRVISAATLVAGELVASSTINAGTEIDLSVAWDHDALRLTVRDHGPGLPGQRPSALYLHGRRLTLIAGLSRAFGILPTSDGGKVVWAVLDVPRLSLPDSARDSAAARQKALILQDANSMAKIPFDAGHGLDR
ncbi:MAG TPA: ATP-binding protein [Dermatophilaceae bacterium]